MKQASISMRNRLLLLAGSSILIGTIWLVFDLYQRTVAEEILSSFLRTEAVAIQEGHLLTSVSKNQRMLLSSQFVTGIVLLDCSVSRPQQLISLGEQLEFENCIPNLSANLPSVVSKGFLSVYSAQAVKGRPGLQLVFSVESTFLKTLFGVFASGILFLFGLMFHLLNKLKIREISERSKLLKEAIDGFIDSSHESPFLDQELPQLKEWIRTKKLDLQKAQEKVFESQKKEALVDVAKRLAHDIRSPLQTLGIIFEDLNHLSAHKRKLVQLAMNRIHQITTGFVSNHTVLDVSSIQKPEKVWIWALLDKMTLEKRTQYQNRDLDMKLTSTHEAISCFVLGSPGELARTISNLIDNSSEAIEDAGSISIDLKVVEGQLVIQISDTGRGISADVLEKIGEKGFSYQKNGNGLGVYYAKKLIKDMGGIFEINSGVGFGTLVKIYLPLASEPAWFTKSLPTANQIAILDDDAIIHERILAILGNKTEVQTFKDPRLLRKWIREGTEDFVLISDYDLGEGKVTGLDFILNHDLQEKAILITNSYDDVDLQNRIVEAGIKMLPKPLLAVPETVNQSRV